MTTPQDQTVRDAGYILSNIAFNLAQKVGHALTSDDVSMLDQARKGWDRAISDAQPQQPAGWRDIASAPKDGSEFIACWARQNNVQQIVKRNKIHGYWESKGEPVLGFYANATHWMPLPSPPGAHPAEQQEGGDVEPYGVIVCERHIPNAIETFVPIRFYRESEWPEDKYSKVIVYAAMTGGNGNG